jgi:hypothetical protein
MIETLKVVKMPVMRLFNHSRGAKRAVTQAGQSNAPKARAFISYSRADSDFAERVLVELADRAIEAYLDKRDIAPAENWRQRLVDLIAASETVIFILTPSSAGSEVCAWEVAEAERLGKRIVPLLHREPGKVRPPEALTSLNYIFARKQDALPDAMDRLAQAVLTDITWVREHTRLGMTAEQWRKSSQSTANILRGDELARAEAWLAMTPASSTSLIDLHKDYIAMSRNEFDEEEAERRNTLRKFLDNQSRFLSDKARSRLNAGDPIEALLIALLGLPDETAATPLSRERPVTPEAFSVLCEALDAAYALQFLGDSRADTLWGVFARGGAYFAGASGNCVTLWRTTPAFAEIAQLPGDGATHVAFSSDGARMCICWRDSRITVHASDTGALLHTISTPNSTEAAFNWSGRWLAAKGAETTELWLLEGEPEKKAATPQVTQVAESWFRPVVRARPWRGETLQPRERAQSVTPSSENVFSIERCRLPLKYVTCEAISKCGHFAARAYEFHNGALIFERAEDGVFRDTAWIEHDRYSWREIGVSSVMFSADGEYLLTGSWDKTARIWDIRNGVEIRRFEHSQEVVSALFSLNEQFVVTHTDGDWCTRLFAVGSGAQIELRCGNLDRNHRPSFDEFGNLVLTSSTGERTSFPEALDVSRWIAAARDLCHTALTTEQRRQLYIDEQPSNWHAHLATAPHLPGIRIAPHGSRGEQADYAREVIVQAAAQLFTEVLAAAPVGADGLYAIAGAVVDHFDSMITPVVKQAGWMEQYNLDFELAAELYSGLVQAALSAGHTDLAQLMLKNYRGPTTGAIRDLREATS